MYLLGWNILGKFYNVPDMQVELVGWDSSTSDLTAGVILNVDWNLYALKLCYTQVQIIHFLTYKHYTIITCSSMVTYSKE